MSGTKLISPTNTRNMGYPVEPGNRRSWIAAGTLETPVNI